MPYDPTTRTTGKRPTTSTPIIWSDYLDNLEYDSEYYEEMRSAAEEEFIEKGPTHLLEAVYCDPCKSRVMDISVKNIFTSDPPGSLQLPDNIFSAFPGKDL